MIDFGNARDFDELESMDQAIQQDPSEHVGDILEETPNEDTTRIYFQNINGLAWNQEGGSWPYICEAMACIQADIACFCETNTDTNQYKIRTQMESICQKSFSQSRLVMSTSKYTTSTAYKPGGTAILACNGITASITNHSRDRMGRWSSLTFNTKTNRKIRVIVAYQVCAGTKTGTGSAASQQQAQLLEELALDATDGYQRTQPRQAFATELQSFIKQAQAANEDIILMGDFNEEMDTADSGIAQLAQNCDLADLMSIRLKTSKLPATYQRGPRRIDFVLMTPSLVLHVQAAGYDPFGYRIHSDHRGLFIDFSTDALFQQEINPLAPSPRRDFKSTSPKVVTKYVTSKIKYLHDHRFFERLQELESSSTPNHPLAEALDRDFQRAAVHAAKKCSRKDQAPWSPKLARCWATLHFFRLARSAIRNDVNYRPAITRLQNMWPELPKHIPTNVNDIQNGYNQAISDLKEIRRMAQESRDEFLQQKAALYTALDEAKKARIVKRLIRAETQHRIYKKIRYLRNADSGSLGLSRLKIPKDVPIRETAAIRKLPDSPEHWETITVPKQIEQLLLQRNQHHFGQAEGTPFTIPPLKSHIGYKADGLAADLILEGEIEFQSIPEATNLLITHLKRRTAKELDGQITKDQILGKLKNWKETTSTSPSGCHLGHYHCMWRPTNIPLHTEEGAQIQSHQKALLSATATLLNYALKHQYTFDRWTKIVNIILQKDANNPRIHRLRVIHIYEADYNLLLAVKWRQAMYHAEELSLLNNGLYGSRPGRSAHDPVMIEVLQNEIYRMSMKSGVNFDLDAMSCYDRIVINVASLSCRSMGMNKSVVMVNAQTLEAAKYYLKTQLGISESYYMHQHDNPIHGTGQGSGNSPTIWCFVCSILFDALETGAHGATFTSYDQSITLPLFMIGFVDDCTQRVNKFSDHAQPSSDTLMTLMEHDVQLWNDLLWSSGGALEHSKCSFHMIQSNWTKDGHPFLQGGVLSRTIQLNDRGHITPATQLSNYTSHKTLGCHINPAHVHAQAWKVAQEKNEYFSQLLETNFLSRSEAWTFYTAFYLPSITYPLPLSPLTKTQCDQLDTRFLRSLIPRCGFNRNMSKAIRYAPPAIGGAGFKQLYLEQGTLLLQHVIKHLNSPNTTIGKLMVMAITWTQAFIGTSAIFLTEVHTPIPPIGPSILLDTRNFLKDIGGHLRLQGIPLPRLLRENDRFIMDIVLSQQIWKQRHHLQINSCRRYLQAQTLADICNLPGTQVLPQAISGSPHTACETSRISTFNQPKPGKQAWTTWCRFLRTIGTKHGRLYTPLGNWTVPYLSTRHCPAYVYDPITDDLYSYNTESRLYRKHQRLTPGRFSLPSVEAEVPHRSYPTAVHLLNTCIIPEKNFTITDCHHNATQQTARIAPNDTRWEHELISHVQRLQPREVTQHIMEQGNFLSCSDGSAIDETGNFGFVISTPQGIRIAKGNGPAPGAYPNSFRSEAYGVLACLRWIHREMQTLDIEPPSCCQVVHYLDNKSVIQRIQQTIASRSRIPNHQLLSDQDVIEEIVATWRHLPVHITFNWVKGHQDQQRPIFLLPLEAQLNCEADHEAACTNHYDREAHNIVTALPHSPCQLIIQHKSITAHLKRRVYNSATSGPLRRYVSSKFDWDDITYESIDWTMAQQILRKYANQWTTIVKHIYDISPTGKIAHRNNPHLPHSCPTCDSPYEDNIHVIQCPHPKRSEWRNKTLAKIRQQDTIHSDPYLMDILQDGLCRLHHNMTPPPYSAYPSKYHDLLRSQNEIGWVHLYKGRWSVIWKVLQSQYKEEQSTHSNTLVHSGSQWVLNLGRLLVDQWLALWDQRNTDRHGKDQTLDEALRIRVLQSQLQELYSYRTQVCPMDITIFHESATDHMAKHTWNAIEDWINIYKSAILASVQQSKKLGLRRNRLITDYPMTNPIALPRQQASLSAGLPPG